MCMMNGGWAFMAPLGMIAMVGFWALVIWAGVRFYRSWSAHPSRRAEETLARRFATGEIDEHEYRDRLDTLRHETTGSSWDSLV
jgi:putative membrane protein